MIDRYFTKEIEEHNIKAKEFDDLKNVESMFEWKKVDVCLKDQNGKVIFEQKDCDFPEHYSQTACDIIASKYFYRGAEEKSLLDIVYRMTEFWRRALVDEGILESDESYDFADEISYLIYNQMWAPNSPQWFNTGVVREYKDYGAKNDDGLFYFDPIKDRAVRTGEDGERTQASACYILDIKDQLIGESSITDHYVTETKLFKAGSGCGTNFSPLRAEGEKLSGGGTSSGMMSYLKGLDVNAGTIKSGGTTRRAAKMVIVDADHPEIENFINWKVKEEEKAKALIRAGYDSSIGGEAYSTVSGQNSNNSVRVSDDFMDAVLYDKKFNLKGRVDNSLDREIDANDLFEKMAKAAWECGDPGIQFKDRINDWNTCSNSGEINASNPCGEFVFLDNTACNLSSINLEKFITKDEIDLDGLYHAIRLAQLAMEASIYWGEYPTREIAKNSYNFRPTGLGVTGLAGALENLGLSYDSREARAWAAAICSYITATSYEISAEMAERVGAFNEYSRNREVMRDVLSRHASNCWAIDDCDDNYLELLRERALDRWSSALEHALEGKSGFRNAQVTCLAPTGTISLAMDSTSTGIEPYYSRKTIKKLADGSTIEQEIDAIKTAVEISPLDHVKMVAAIQPNISGAISKTVNMPQSSTVEDIKKVFRQAHSLGCKSITVYRDGSKGTQVLETKKETGFKVVDREESSGTTKWKDIYFPCVMPDGETRYTTWGKIQKAVQEIENETVKLKRSKPSGIRPSKTHSAKIGDIQLYITVGYYDDGSIAEIFVNTDRQGEVVNGLLASLSKVISHLLQYGIEPSKIAKILRCQKYEPAGLVERHPYIKMTSSISDLIAKVIEFETGNYSRIEIKPEEPAEFKLYDNDIAVEGLRELTNRILEEQGGVFNSPDMDDYDDSGDPYWEKRETEKVYGEVCSNCGSSELVRSGTCKTCLVCGSTTGCG